MADRTLYVAVIGSGVADAQRDAEAEAVGHGLGSSGVVLVCGGLGGVMEAACRGARDAGGVTVGLLPGADRRGANPHLDIALPTGMGELRNGLIVRAADAVIAVGGEYGTLSEIALALKLRRPVIGVHTWELRRAGQTDRGVQVVESAAAAVAAAIAAATRHRTAVS